MKNYIIASLILITILSVASIYQTISLANLRAEISEKKYIEIVNLKINEIETSEAQARQAIALTHRCLNVADELLWTN